MTGTRNCRHNTRGRKYPNQNWVPRQDEKGEPILHTMVLETSICWEHRDQRGRAVPCRMEMSSHATEACLRVDR